MRPYRLQADRRLFANKNIRMRKELISSEPKPGYPLTIAQNMYGVASLPDTLLKAIIETKLGKPKKYVYSCLNFSLLKTAVQNVSAYAHRQSGREILLCPPWVHKPPCTVR